MENRLKELLAERKLKSKDLAEYLGRPQQSVSNWVRKKNNLNPNLYTALRIALFFQLSVEDIFILNLENEQNND